MSVGVNAHLPEGQASQTDGVLSEHSGDFLRLARLWQRRSHHSWVFAAVNSPHYRNALMARLDGLAPAVRIQIETGHRPSDWLAALTAAGQSGAQRAHVVLAEGWLPDAPWWQEANVLRERLADAFAHPVVLWLPDACISEAARVAPDLWNWREAVVDFSLAMGQPLAALTTTEFSSATGPDKSTVQARLADIQTYLATHGGESAATAQLKLEAASAYERLGEWALAQDYAQQAFDAFSTQNNERMATHAKGKIADIFQARGRLDEALEIWRNQVLPVFEQAGYIPEASISRERIAALELLQKRSTRSVMDQSLRNGGVSRAE